MLLKLDFSVRRDAVVGGGQDSLGMIDVFTTNWLRPGFPTAAVLRRGSPRPGISSPRANANMYETTCERFCNTIVLLSAD